jgi:sucrose-6-phosphate hydrolase SacC (GH32 family)
MGRRILFGWIPGWNWELFQIGRGWNGCMALPRVLTLDAKHRILQEPAAELKKLRVHESLVEKTKVALDDSQSPLRAQIDFQSEVLAELSAITAAECGLRFFSGENVIDIKCHPQRLLIEVADTPVPLPSGEQSRLSLHVFIDRSVVEIYINDGEVVVSKMFNTALTNPRLEVYARDGSMKIDSLRVWRLNAAERKFAYPELDNI